MTEAELKGKNGFVFSSSEIHAFLHRKRRLTAAATLENPKNNRPDNHYTRKQLLRRAA